MQNVTESFKSMQQQQERGIEHHRLFYIHSKKSGFTSLATASDQYLKAYEAYNDVLRAIEEHPGKNHPSCRGIVTQLRLETEGLLGLLHFEDARSRTERRNAVAEVLAVRSELGWVPDIGLRARNLILLLRMVPFWQRGQYLRRALEATSQRYAFMYRPHVWMALLGNRVYRHYED